MAWRFQPSKFKNTTPKVPKKEETIFDLPIGGLSCTNNGIQSSASFLAFHIEGEGGKLGVLPLKTIGRRLRKDISIVCAHGDLVDDFSFLPFNENLLVTCSRDDKLKIWNCENFGDLENAQTIGDPFASIDLGDGHLLDCLAPHKTAGDIVAVASGERAMVVDIGAQKIIMEVSGAIERAQAIDWSSDGKILAISSNKGRNAHIFDPRASSKPIFDISIHSGLGREGRVIFTDDKLVSSGFTNKRVQELQLFDHRDWTKKIHAEEFSSTTGVLIPLYDADTKLLFLAGKGTNIFTTAEIQEKNPILSRVHEQPLNDQLLGACLMNKRSCDVMSGEVQKFFQLTKNSIIPFPCIVPRRTYRDFHAELFPDTIGSKSGCTAEEWVKGSNELPPKISLNPNPTALQQPQNVIAPTVIEVSDLKPEKIASSEKEELPKVRPPWRVNANANSAQNVQKTVENGNHQKPYPGSIENGKTEHTSLETKPPTAETAPKQLSVRFRPQGNDTPQTRASHMPTTDVKKTISDVRDRRKSCVFGQVTSIFRFVETIVGGKTKTFTHLRNLNTRLPIESNGFCVSSTHAAVPLSGAAGIVAIFELTNPCKVPDGVIDAIQNRAGVTDMIWNPFNPKELAVGLDSGSVNIWRIDESIPCVGSANDENDGDESEEGKEKPEKPRLFDLQPYKALKIGGSEKVTHVRYNPVASNIIAVALNDGTISIWNTETEERLRSFKGHSSSILSISWSTLGNKLASVAKDSQLNIYEPQLGDDCLVAQRQVLSSTRGARIQFVCNDTMVLVAGFSKTSQRQCTLYRSEDLKELHTQEMDVNTQPLTPHYDVDTSVLFLTGKGDRIIQMYEISTNTPYFLPLAHFTAPSGHQALSLQHKNLCDVKAVEFQRGFRLTEKTLEMVSFRVPRVKKDLFQRDVFPPALITWRPSQTAAEWINGGLVMPTFEDLCPTGMPEYEAASSTPALSGRSSKSPEASTTSTASLDTNEAQKPINAAQPQPLLKPSNGTNYTTEHSAPVAPTTENLTENKLSSIKDEPEVEKPQTGLPIAPKRNKVLAYDDREIKHTSFASAPQIEIGWKNSVLDKDDSHKIQKKVESSWMEKIGVDNALEQDRMEGVAEEEWLE